MIVLMLVIFFIALSAFVLYQVKKKNKKSFLLFFVIILPALFLLISNDSIVYKSSNKDVYDIANFVSDYKFKDNEPSIQTVLGKNAVVTNYKLNEVTDFNNKNIIIKRFEFENAETAKLLVKPLLTDELSTFLLSGLYSRNALSFVNKKSSDDKYYFKTPFYWSHLVFENEKYIIYSTLTSLSRYGAGDFVFFNLPCDCKTLISIQSDQYVYLVLK